METETETGQQKSLSEVYDKAMDSAEKKYNARLYPYRKKIADIEEED